MTAPTHSLDRTVVIRATPDVVFRYFTDSARWAAWWGVGSTIDAQPGGAMKIVLPGNVAAGGNVVELKAPERMVFTYGFESGTPMAVGASRVTIQLAAISAGTRVSLRHEFAEEAPRDEFVQGWRYQLSLFGNVVANEVNAKAVDQVDAWFDVWANPDAAARLLVLDRIAEPSVTFRDQYSNLTGVADIQAHITAAQHFMPGVRLRRAGSVRHCQGIVLADWTVAGPSGTTVMQGTNVFEFGGAGLLESVVGIATKT